MLTRRCECKRRMHRMWTKEETVLRSICVCHRRLMAQELPVSNTAVGETSWHRVVASQAAITVIFCFSQRTGVASMARVVI